MKTAIIDVDSLIYTSCHPKKILGENGEPEIKDDKFVYEENNLDYVLSKSESLITSILKESTCDNYIGFISGKNTNDYRKNICSNYKKNRDNKTKSIYFNLVTEFLILKYKFTKINNIEVDDAINITRLNVDKYIIVGIDKDLFQIPGEHYNWRNKTFTTISKEEADFNFWKSMIIGDNADNIQGLFMKGEKYIEKIKLKDSKNIIQDVFKEYISHYQKESLAIENFYKNYKLLKLLDNYEGFKLIEPIEIID